MGSRDIGYRVQGLVDLDFDVELTGFSLAEIDFVLDEAGEADPDAPDAAQDAVPDVTCPAISCMGDVWILGRHKLVCGDARSSDDYARPLWNERIDMVFTDPPYNVAIDSNFCGLGSVNHLPVLARRRTLFDGSCLAGGPLASWVPYNETWHANGMRFAAGIKALRFTSTQIVGTM